jgi:hypothetical protein
MHEHMVGLLSVLVDPAGIIQGAPRASAPSGKALSVIVEFDQHAAVIENAVPVQGFLVNFDPGVEDFDLTFQPGKALKIVRMKPRISFRGAIPFRRRERPNRLIESRRSFVFSQVLFSVSVSRPFAISRSAFSRDSTNATQSRSILNRKGSLFIEEMRIIGNIFAHGSKYPD